MNDIIISNPRVLVSANPEKWKYFDKIECQDLVQDIKALLRKYDVEALVVFKQW